MRRLSNPGLVSFVFSLLVVTCGAVLAQPQFEGIIESKNTTTDERGKPQQFTMTMYVKQDMVKITNSPIGSSPGSTMIYRGDMKVVWMVNEEDKSYFEIRHDEQPEQIFSPSGPNTKEPVVRKTGKKKQVLGYACEQVVVSIDNLKTEIWATKSLGHVYSTISKVLGGESAAPGDGWESKIMKMGYYPLIASTTAEGKILESQEITKIQRKPLAQGIFELPAGFKRQSTGGMMDGNSNPE
jgi:hypothetical protein